MPTNSFIANVNILADNLENILKANELFDEDVIPVLREIAELDLMLVVQDLAKGNFEGNKKLDVRLIFNMKDYNDDLTDEELHDLWFDLNRSVAYSNVIATFRDGFVGTYPINVGTIDSDLVSRIETQLRLNQSFMSKLEGTDFGEVKNDPDSILRFVPINNEVSNLKHIELVVESGSLTRAKEARPKFQWLDTTSSLEVISNNINELLDLMGDWQDLVNLASNVTELLDIQRYLPELVTNPMSIWKLRNELYQLYLDSPEILKSKEYSDSAKISAESAALSATQAQETVNRTATPTKIGSVYSASPQHIIDGAAGHMVDAAQMKKEFDDKVQEATTSTLGLVQYAEWADVATRTGNGVVTATTIGAYIGGGSGGGGGTNVGVNTDPTSGLMYYIIEASTRLLHMFGKVTATTANPIVIDLPASMVNLKNKSVTGMVLSTPYTSFAVREDSTTISDLNHINVGIWDGSTSAFVAGDFYVQVIAEITSGSLPDAPVGFTITSPQTGRMVIAKS